MNYGLGAFAGGLAQGLQSGMGMALAVDRNERQNKESEMLMQRGGLELAKLKRGEEDAQITLGANKAASDAMAAFDAELQANPAKYAQYDKNQLLDERRLVGDNAAITFGVKSGRPDLVDSFYEQGRALNEAALKRDAQMSYTRFKASGGRDASGVSDLLTKRFRDGNSYAITPQIDPATGQITGYWHETTPSGDESKKKGERISVEKMNELVELANDPAKFAAAEQAARQKALETRAKIIEERSKPITTQAGAITTIPGLNGEADRVIKNDKLIANGRNGIYNPTTGEWLYNTDAPAATTGGKESVFAQKRQAWLAINPGDEKGALEFAGGRRQISARDARTKAETIANGMKDSMGQPLSATAKKTAADQIYGRIISANEIGETAPAGGLGSVVPAAQPAPAQGTSLPPLSNFLKK